MQTRKNIMLGVPDQYQMSLYMILKILIHTMEKKKQLFCQNFTNTTLPEALRYDCRPNNHRMASFYQ